MNDTLEQYFTDKLLAPIKEWQKEATTNKAFYLGEKEFEYIPTILGHEPTVRFPDGMNCPTCGNEALFIRDRGFKDGSGKVHTCTNESCKSYNLYFYP